MTKKIITKKKTKKKNTAKVSIKEVMPQHNGKNLSLVPIKAMPVTTKQILTMVQKTPQNHIYTRPGKGGGTFEYVTGVYVKKVLNFVFGFNWDFEIVNEEEKHGQIVVLGKITVKDGKGHTVSKMQYGRADIKLKKADKIPMDYGNDKKAAATDSLKKCASEFGIASDVYGKNEFKDLGVEVTENGTKPQVVVQNSTQANTGTKKNPPATDYCQKLEEYIMSQETVSKNEIVSWINMVLGTKHPKSLLTNQSLSQKVLAQLLKA